MSAYSYAKRESVKEGFVPVLIKADDETLWECLIMNSDPDSDGEDDYAFDPDKVADYHLYDDRGLDVLGSSRELLLPLYHQFHGWILEYNLEQIDRVFTADQPQRQKFTIDGRRFSSMAGFYDEVERVFTFGLDRKIGRNLNAFNDILRGGFGRHEYGQPIHIQWLAYEKSVRNLGKETMDTIVEIILDTDHSGHDCTLERL